MPHYCKICNSYDCKHSFSIGKTRFVKEFSGSSPPEIFVGRWNYPNVYAGIISPEEHGDTSEFSSPELWHSKKLQINEIENMRNKLIYGRSRTNIHKNATRFMDTVKEVAMTNKPISTEFTLKKPIKKEEHTERNVPLISNAANVEKVRLQENPKVEKKVDYLVNDTDVKSAISIKELYSSGIQVSNIIKLLSAGLLGLKKNRRLVPTRWAITATDDTLSKEKLRKLRTNKELQEIQVFNSEYLGNHYEFLLLPDKYSFEVIEISVQNGGMWHDYEDFFPRKKYADSVTGAYYANRLALTEYLEKIKRQCQCLVLREVRPEYNVPLGVGILRQTSREAFSRKPQTFQTISEALQNIQTRLTLPISQFTNSSWLLKNFGKQSRITKFL